jgi:hypothetical protein
MRRYGRPQEDTSFLGSKPTSARRTLPENIETYNLERKDVE